MNKSSLVVVMISVSIFSLFSMELNLNHMQQHVQQYDISHHIRATKEKYLRLRKAGTANQEDLTKIVAKIFFGRSSANWFFLNDCICQLKADKNKE